MPRRMARLPAGTLLRIDTAPEETCCEYFSCKHLPALEFGRSPEVRMKADHVNSMDGKRRLKALNREYRQSFLEGNWLAYPLGIPNILRVFGPRPQYFEANMHAWRISMWAGPLPRQVKEAIAVAVSCANQCPYCVDAHSIFLQASGMRAARAERIAALVRDFIDSNRSNGHKLRERFQHAGFEPDLSRFIAIAVRFTTAATESAPRSRSIADELCGGPLTTEDVNCLGVAVMFDIVNRVANALCIEPEMAPWRRSSVIRQVTRPVFGMLIRYAECFDLEPADTRKAIQNIEDLEQLFRDRGFEWMPVPFENLVLAPHLLEALRTLIEASFIAPTLDPALQLSVRKMVLGLTAPVRPDVAPDSPVGSGPHPSLPRPSHATWTDAVEPDSEKDRACLTLAATMVKDSYKITPGDLVRLRSLGLTEVEILDLVYWTAVWFGVGHLDRVFRPGS